jgi:hypothetical protein
MESSRVCLAGRRIANELGRECSEELKARHGVSQETLLAPKTISVLLGSAHAFYVA